MCCSLPERLINLNYFNIAIGFVPGRYCANHMLTNKKPRLRRGFSIRVSEEQLSRG